jgi:anti-sigma B factor antagonist
MSAHYEIRHQDPDITVTAISGQLNLGNRLADLEHQIKLRIQEGSRKMIMELTGLAYIDSAGLGMIAACAGVMSREGGKFAVVSPAGKVKEMFELTRMDRVIDVFPDLDSALASFPVAKAPPA